MIMELTNTTSWISFFIFTAFVGILFLIIKAIYHFMPVNVLVKNKRYRARFMMQRFKNLADSIFIFMIIGQFIHVNFIYHLLIVTFLSIMFFAQIRDYFSGKIFQFRNNIFIDMEITLENSRGKIRKIGLFGLYLFTNDGINYYSYYLLISRGFSFYTSNRLGKNQKLKLRITARELHLSLDLIIDHLSSTPFINWHIAPQLSKTDLSSNTYDVTMNLFSHINPQEIVDLLEERGLECKILL